MIRFASGAIAALILVTSLHLAAPVAAIGSPALVTADGSKSVNPRPARGKAKAPVARPIPACLEDELIVGRGDYNGDGFWTRYECVAFDSPEFGPASSSILYEDGSVGVYDLDGELLGQACILPDWGCE